MTGSFATGGDWLDLGDGLRGFYARPAAAGPWPAVVIFIEAFGVNDHFRRLAARFADAGYCALVPDIYHGDVFAYDDMENAIARLRGMDDGTVMAETGRALDALAARDEVRSGPVAATGFCMGGRLAFLANAAHAGRIGATVGFYGGGIAPVADRAGRKPLLDRIPEMRAPILLCYGAKDGGILPDEHARIAEALTAANKSYGLRVFADAGHGYFCEDRPVYHPGAAAESWELMLDFFLRHLA